MMKLIQSPIRRFLQLTAAVLVMVGLAACTDQPEDDAILDDTTMVPSDTTMMMEPDTMRSDTVDVGLIDFDINMPTNLPAGTTVFRVTNEGTVEHSFEVEGQGTEEALPSPLQPGESQTFSVDLQEGSYVAYCPVGDHEERGMEVDLTVVPSGGMGGMGGGDDMNQMDGAGGTGGTEMSRPTL